MDVYYEQKPSSALERVAKRIGAEPLSERSLNFTYSTTFPALALGWNNVLLLNGLTQGTSGSNRIGREILMKSIDWFFQVTSTQRYMLVYDSQANGTAINVSDLVQDTGDQYSPYNFSNRDRFHIIWDSLFDTTPEIATINRNRDFPLDLSTYYNSGNAGTIADITSGSLYFVCYSSGVAAAPPFMAMLYYEE